MQAGKVSASQSGEKDTFEVPIIKHSNKGAPLGPDEVLFRRRGAPERYAEYDIYYSHERDLPRGGRGVLPESDLLKAIHTYSSRYYGSQRRNNHQQGFGGVDERSMDESALLAFGILLEEASREVLGHRGDLVFAEADTALGDDATRDESYLPRVTAGWHEVGHRVNPKKKKRRLASPDPFVTET